MKKIETQENDPYTNAGLSISTWLYWIADGAQLVGENPNFTDGNTDGLYPNYNTFQLEIDFAADMILISYI